MVSVSDWLPYLGVALLVIFLVEFWIRNRCLPPGPWGWPFFGYYFNLDDRPYLTLMDLSKKYGEVLSFRTIGGIPFIVLNGIDVIKEVLVSRADEFIGRPLDMNFLKWLDDGYGIVQEEGTAWKEQRRFFLTTAKNYGFGKMDIEGFAHDKINELVNDIKKVGNKAIDLHLHISYVTGNVISRILCSKKISKDDPAFIEISKRNLEAVLFFSDRRLFLAGPFLEHFVMKVLPSGRKISKSKSIFENYTSEIVDEHVRNLDIRHPKDFIDSYLIHMKSLEEKGQLANSSFSLLRLKKVFFGMLMEGTETVSTTIIALLGELAHHLDVQKQAQKALDEVVGHERLPSWSDKKDLPYMNALILELFRTSLVFAISTYYSNFEETEIRGHRIPKRSFIVANLYSVNNDPKIYPNPSKFDPNRFLGESGQRIKQEVPIPFGVGKRSCIGESLASMEVFLIISAILQNFTLYPAEDGKVRLEPRAK